MKKIIYGLLLLLIMSISAQAYTIGGAYASLVSCDWGQYGYEYGYIGTYNVNGKCIKYSLVIITANIDFYSVEN